MFNTIKNDTDLNSYPQQIKFHYQVYGLCVGSNQPIPSLTPLVNSAIDVSINLSGDCNYQLQIPESFWRTLPLPLSHHHTKLQVWQAQWGKIKLIRRRFHHHLHPLDIIVNDSGSHVWIQNTWNAPIEDIHALLTGPVLGGVLRLRSKSCLHASAVLINNQVILFLGDKGCGKSTMAAALVCAGHKVLSDDIAVLSPQSGGFLIESGYSRLRMYPASLQAIGHHPSNLDPVLYGGEKRYFPLSSTADSSTHFQPKPHPLAAIYLLQQRKPDIDYPSLSRMSPSATLLALIQHSYARYMILKPEYQQLDFKLLGDIANTIPVSILHRPDNLDELPQLCELVIADVHSIIE